jgi:hypothetical protein
MACQNDRGPVIQCVLDGRDRGSNSLGVGDFTGLLVLGDVEIDTDEEAFAGEIEILDGFFSHAE